MMIVSWFLCHDAHAAMGWTMPLVLMQMCAADTLYLKGEQNKVFY